MTKIGVFSDTHRHIANLSQGIDFLKELGVSLFIHLGDDYTDMDDTGERDFIRVPGVYCDAYQAKNVENRIIKNITGWRLLLTHTLQSHPNDLPEDPDPDELIRLRKVDVVLFGHTHVPEIRHEEPIIFFNPGHMKNEDKRGNPATFGFVELTIDTMLARIYRLRDHSVLMEERFRKS